MRNVDFYRAAYKFLQRLPRKQWRQVSERIEGLLANPHPSDSKTLEGFPNFRRADIGEYRIIYFATKELVYVALVGKRNDDDVYKRFRRLFG